MKPNIVKEVITELYRFRIGKFVPGVFVFVFTLLGASCDSQRPLSEQPSPPKVAPKPGTGIDGTGKPVIFGGFIYPGAGTNVGTFEVDAPLRTDTSKTAYFSFEINFHVAGIRWLELSWIPSSGPAILIRQIDSPCHKPQFTSAQLRLMHTRSLTQTGRSTSASYNLEVDRMLDAGVPVQWTTCTLTQNGEVISPNNAGVDYNLAIMLPSRILGSGGTLSVVARNIVGGAASLPTELRIRKTETMVGVAGDSVLWGQGVPEAAKFYSLFLNLDVVPLTGSGRLTRKSHSGAVINRPGASRTIAGAGCSTASTPLPGEVPVATPTIQCQVFDLARLNCIVAGIGVDPVPQFFCDGNSPISGMPLTTITFDSGPRYDFVLMNGCVNDLGPIDMLLGRKGFDNPEHLTNRINQECDLTNGLADLRRFLPNAVIPFLGYQLLVSNASDPLATGCFPIPPLGTLPAAILATPMMALVTALATPVKGEISTRASTFQRLSGSAMSSSAVILNQVGEGTGAVVFVAMTGVFTPITAFLAPGSLLFPVTCTSTAFLGPVDPVAGARAIACTAVFNSTGSTPNSVDEEGCLRASGLHPTASANAVMRTVLRSRLAGTLRPAP